MFFFRQMTIIERRQTERDKMRAERQRMTLYEDGIFEYEDFSGCGHKLS